MRQVEGRTTPPSSPGPLLERERELELLAAALGAADSGASGLVLVQGAAGIGKSRLLAAARALAEERGLRVLAARGGELEMDFPFGIVRQLFESQLVDESTRSRLLSGAARSAAPVFGWSDARGVDEPLSEGTFAALHGLFWLTLNLSSERTLLLAVDDLHWCDSASLRFLAYLARRLEDLPVVLLASLRSSEPEADRSILDELISEPQAQMLMPGPLTAAAVAEVVRDRMGEGVATAFAEACHASTDGNPLLLNELLKTLVADRVPPDAAHVHVVAELGPKAASRTVLLRLARLSADAVHVARAISALGDGAELSIVAELERLAPPALSAATRELVQAEILRPEPPLGFVHPLVQGAVYHDLAPGERELYHERAATLLAGRGAPPEQIAAHVLAMPARGEDWVVDVLRAAADAAVAKGDVDAAISSLRRALDEPPRPQLRRELLLELGQLEGKTVLPAAAGHLRSAYELADEPSARGHAALQLARTLLFLGAPDEAAALAGRVARELPAELADLAQNLEAVEVFAPVFGAEPHADRLERLLAYREIDGSAGVGAKALAAVASWNWAVSAGPADRVCALARTALQGGELLAADGLMSIVAMGPLALADLEEAVVMLEAYRAEAHRQGAVFRIAGAQIWNGYTQYLRGELGEAEFELRASLETVALWGLPTQSSARTPSSFLAEVLVERGAVGEARALLDAAASPPPGSERMILLDRARMRLLLAEGRLEEALAHADVYELHAGWKRHPRYVPWRSLKAQALDRLGRHDEAVALASEELEIARSWGSPGTVGRSMRVLGAILRADGIAYLEEACSLLEEAPARLEHAKALAALGAALRRAGKPTEARESLRRALELADISGAQPLADGVRTEIYATGARPRTTALRGVLALTASERRVADLAAAGQTNRDIAQTLYVTPKTVEVHLSNAYRKLGIGSRRELARVLAGPA
ncbi:MAG: AAA family ATPase [Actinobacteria bacterium]|nr:AAA family ATPase [Actinomycetota bacterium]